MRVKLPSGTGTVTDTMFRSTNKVGGCTLDRLKFCVVHLQLQLAIEGIAGTRPGLNHCCCCCDRGCGRSHRCHGSTGPKVIWMWVKLPSGTGTVTDTVFPPIQSTNKVGGRTLDRLKFCVVHLQLRLAIRGIRANDVTRGRSNVRLWYAKYKYDGLV